MDFDDAVDWTCHVKDKIPFFLRAIQGRSNKGFYHYTLSGDYRKNEDWGVFNSVCAARILYILNHLSKEDINQISKHILSFERGDGGIYDSYFLKRYRSYQLYAAITALKWNIVYNGGSSVIRALTRSAYSGLHCLNEVPANHFVDTPSNRKEIEQYINKLDWAKPWGAGSHFSALILFLVFQTRNMKCNSSNAHDLINHAFSIADSLRNKDGSWGYCPETMSPIQKINGCMKMLLAYQWTNRMPENVDLMIDLCLIHEDVRGDGCNNLDTILVLYECSKHTNYKHNEIVQFCLNRFDIYKKHWWDNEGGFSFFERKSIDNLYGAKIAYAKPEPDIHGTWLHLYGLSMIAHICGMNKQLSFQVPLI